MKIFRFRKILKLAEKYTDYKILYLLKELAQKNDKRE